MNHNTPDTLRIKMPWRNHFPQDYSSVEKSPFLGGLIQNPLGV